MTTRYEAMAVREYTDNQGQARSFWTKVGVGFTNKDGSIGIELDAFPVNGRLVLQIPLSKEERTAKYEQKQNAQQGAQRQNNARRYTNNPGPQQGFGGQPPRPPQQQEQPDYPAEWDNGDAPPFR